MAYFNAPYRPADLTVDSSHSLVAGMQLWFPFTSGTGTSAPCLLHSSHDGTLQSGASWSSSDIGTVLELNGSSEVDFTSDISRNKTAVSCSAWIKPDSVSGLHFVFYEENGTTTHQTRFGLRIDNGSIQCVGRDDDGDSFTRFAQSNTGTVVTGVWQHAVAIFDPTGGGCKVYLDGVDVTTSSDNTGDGFPNTASLNQVIGGIGGNSSFYFDGQIQNLRVWDRAISQQEVTLLHARPWTASNYDTEALWLSPPSSPTLSTASEATALMANCVGWWPLTEGTGTTAKDITSNANDGTIGGTANWESGSLGRNLKFDGTSSFIDTGTTPAATSLPLTVSAWIKPSATTNRCMIASSWLSSGTNRAFLCELTASNALTCYITSDGTFSTNSSMTTTGTLTDGVWYHVVFVIQSGGAIYVDGVSQALSGSLGSSMITPNQKLLIGAVEPGAETFFWAGNVNNVRIFDAALTADQVRLLYERPWIGAEYNETAPLYPPVPSSLTPLDSGNSILTDLEGWWPLTETDNYASGAADISGNGNNGTQSGGVLSEFGELGTVASFDGSNDYIAEDVSTPGAVNSAKYAMTFSCWMYHDDTVGTQYGAVAADTGTSTTYVGTRRSSSGNTGFIARFGGSQALVETATSTSTWHHVVGVIESSTSVKLYLDGVLVGTDTTDITGSGTCNVFTIGALRYGSSPAYFDGNISNVRIWSRSLSSSEIADLYYEPWIGSAYPSTGGVTPSYFVAAQFNRLGIGPRFRRL